MAHRFSGPGRPYDGLTRATARGPVWTGRARFIPEKLAEPLRWRKARRVFVNSMSDLFHEDITDEQIAAVFGIMAACPRHTFQVLTKRPERMGRWFARLPMDPGFHLAGEADEALNQLARDGSKSAPRFWNPLYAQLGETKSIAWPLPNVHLGVSVEDQRSADERIPLLLQVPAAVRWVSYEPALGAADLSIYLREHACDEWPQERAKGALGCCAHPMDPLSWLVVGGESGPGARPCNVTWIRSVVRQCREAQVPVFVKQLGSNSVRRESIEAFATFTPDAARAYPVPPTEMVTRFRSRDRAGADPDEWPEDLRVREWPR